MTKHLHLKKVLAAVLTIAALATGQQAFATVTETITIKGLKQSNGNISYFAFEIRSIWGGASLPGQQGSSYTFNNTNLPGGMVTLNGTLNFQEATQLTDVVTGSTFTVTVENNEQWFYSATVKTLSGTTVTDCSVTVSDDQNTITVSIPSGKTFGQIILDYVPNEPFSSSNTVIGGIATEYIYTGSPIEPVPTVTYNGTVLTAGTDYTVSYANNNALGTATLTVTGTGQYAGTVTRNYNIRAVALSDFNSLGNNTYEIASTTDLDLLAVYVNLGNNSRGLTFKQTADIAYTYTTAWNNSASTENNYTAIGTDAYPFRGTFDGQNYSISGIRVYKGDTSVQGLFGKLNNSTVKRVHLANARITGKNYVGGIAGNSFSSLVEDCTVADNVTIHAVANESFNHGGIVGGNQGTVRRCISQATLSVASNMTGGQQYGGVVGHNFNSGSVTDCIAVGAVIPDVEGRGAIVGYNYNCTLIRNYYRDCKVASNNVTPSGVGMGTSQSGTTTSDVDGAQPLFALTLGTNVTLERTAKATLPGTNNKTYANGADIAGVHYAYPTATVTLGYSGTVPAGQTPLYSVDGTAIEGNTFTMPTADCTVSVEIVDGWSGSGTQSDPYIITTTSHLNLLAEMVKNGVNYSGTYFVLGNDIAYSTAGLGDTDENFTTIGGYFGNSDKNFSGNFNGQGYTISGIRLYKNGTAAPSMNQGLFGRIDGATIENVVLADAHITGYRYVGGLVGNKVSGTVQNCLVLESTITCADKYVGALFGKNTGTITTNYYHNCTVNGTATGAGVGGNGGVSASSDMNGARCVHTLTLGEGITATPAPAVTYNNINYYTAGTEITLGAPQGYAITSATLTYGGSDYLIVGNSFEMPAQDVAVTAVLQARYTFDSTTGALTLNWGEFNKDNKWGSEVTESAVTSVTATDEVSFTGDCYQLFYNFTSCTSMDLTDVNTANVTNMSNMFRDCSGLQSLNISGWNTANVTDMKYMFYGCSGLQSLNISGWNTANVTNMSYMFYGCTGLQSLDLSGWNTTNVTDMSYIFRGCFGLQSLDLSGWNTANVTNMSYMFRSCSVLQSLDLSDWSTANVTNMSHMFYNCSSLQSLNISGWNTANVTDMKYMFYGCRSLQSLNISGWNTANVTDMKYMFYGCRRLQSLNISGWNTANVTNMSYMFYGCTGLQSLNISGWNTANVTNMSYIFRGCSGLQSLDLSGWSTSNVEYMSGMFYGCSILTTIYAGEGWNTSRVNESTDMFDGCTSLVGGMGTTYDAYHTDGEYARIDRGPNSDQPGYFTGRFTKEIAGYEDNESGWYLIASPLAADIAPTAVTNMTNETFDLYYFDQTGGNNGKEWKNWKNEGGDGYHFNLKTGKGYLYANSGNVTLMFTGTPYNGDGKVTLTKADGFEFSGWNLIGNPFSTAATLDKPFYRMNESGTALSAQVEAHNSVAAMEGVFVQASTNNETATFTQANNSKGGEKDAVPMLTLNLTRNRGEAIDNAIVRFDGGHTLEKFSFREGSTKIYIPQDGTDYAIATSNGQGEMPVNFKATENGTYTLTISTTLNSQLSTLNYLHLIDNMTGADVDLLTPEPVEGPATYTFTAKTTDYASRFKLVFSANGNADGDNDAFAFIDASGNIIVNGEGTLQVMDVMGRIIVSHGGHTRCVPTSGMQAGVYVLRLIDGENVKTLKIVIS